MQFLLLVLLAAFLIHIWDKHRVKKPPRKTMAQVREEEEKKRQRELEAAVQLEVAKRTKALLPKPSDIKKEGFCPHCGAPVNPYKKKCEYCDSYLPGIAKSIDRQKEMDMDKAIQTMENRHKEKMEALKNGTQTQEQREEEKKTIIHFLLGFLIFFLIFGVIVPAVLK